MRTIEDYIETFGGMYNGYAFLSGEEMDRADDVLEFLESLRGISLDRFSEICAAERERRLVVLPCGGRFLTDTEIQRGGCIVPMGADYILWIRTKEQREAAEKEDVK